MNGKPSGSSRLNSTRPTVVSMVWFVHSADLGVDDVLVVGGQNQIDELTAVSQPDGAFAWSHIAPASSAMTTSSRSAKRRPCPFAPRRALVR